MDQAGKQPMVPTLLSVAERFVSINGEGPEAGRLAAFVRLAGCNLACAYCDTPWSRDPEAATEVLDVAEVAAWVADAQVGCVTITGGEPLLQQALPALVQMLLALPVRTPAGSPLRVEIETNGACDLAPLDALRVQADGEGWGCNALAFTVDCKLAAAGTEAEAAMLTHNYGLLRAQDAVKFVCGSQADLEQARQVIERFGLAERCAVLLSPVHGRMDAAAIVDYMRDHHMADVRVQIQLHKVIWPGQDRGVTSESVKGSLVRRFVEHTFSMLASSGDQRTDVNVHVIQADSKVQSDLVIHDLRDVTRMMEGFAVRGFGGTDFRPAFDYVRSLRDRGDLADLKGLIYFTDGLGQFPEKTPDFDVAFVMVNDGSRELPPVPPWAMKVVLDEHDIGRLR